MVLKNRPHQRGLTAARFRGVQVGTVEHQYDVSEDRAVLAPGFRVLDERERMILHLRFFEGLTQSQIAQQVGISQMHVSRLLAQTLDRLRSRISRRATSQACRMSFMPPPPGGTVRSTG